MSVRLTALTCMFLCLACGDGSSSNSRTVSRYKKLAALTEQESRALCTDARAQATDDPDFVRSSCSVIGLTVQREDGEVTCEEFRDACIDAALDESACDLAIVQERCPDGTVGEFTDCNAAINESRRASHGNVSCADSYDVVDSYLAIVQDPPPACAGLRTSCPGFFELLIE